MGDRLQSAVIRRVTRLGVALMLLGAALPQVAMAQSAAGSDELYTVSDVAVDVTAETATLARERALLEGQAEALDRVFSAADPPG